MASRAGTLATAVTATLNAGSFSMPFTAVTATNPIYELHEFKELCVTVITRSVVREVSGRGFVAQHFVVDVAVQQLVAQGDTHELEVDALMALVEELADHMDMRVLETVPDYSWVNTSHDPIFEQNMLYNQHTFASLLSLTYRYDRLIT